MWVSQERQCRERIHAFPTERDESLPYKGDQLEFILSKGNRLKAFPKGEGFKTHSFYPFKHQFLVFCFPCK